MAAGDVRMVTLAMVSVYGTSDVGSVGVDCSHVGNSDGDDTCNGDGHVDDDKDNDDGNGTCDANREVADLQITCD